MATAAVENDANLSVGSNARGDGNLAGGGKGGKRTGVDAAAPYVGRVLVPGDAAVDLSTLVATQTSGKAALAVRLGSGLRQEGERVVAMRAGVLRSVQRKKYWLEAPLKRYFPVVEEEVVAYVVEKHAENFDMDIRSSSLATLPVLAFEGATRRNRPNLEIGAAVYARVVRTHPDAEPELACTDASGRAAGFGPLVGGYVVECSTGLARLLLSRPRPPVLDALGDAVQFELAVGLNGRIWVKGENVRATILVANALAEAEDKSAAQQRIMVKALLEAYRNLQS